MKYLFTLFICLVLVTVSYSDSQRWTTDIGFWNTELNGDISWEDLVVDLDNELDFSDDKSFNFGLGYKYNDRIVLKYNYLSLEHSGTVSKAVQFSNINFNINGTLDIDVKMHDFYIAKNMSSWKHKNSTNTKFYLGLGVKAMNVDADVTGTETTTGISRTASESVTAPIPYLSVALDHGFRKNVKGFAQFDFISANVGDVSAKMTDTKLGVTYYFLRKHAQPTDPEWGLKLGYRNYQLGADVDDDNNATTGDINMGYDGIFYAVTCNF